MGKGWEEVDWQTTTGKTGGAGQPLPCCHTHVQKTHHLHLQGEDYRHGPHEAVQGFSPKVSSTLQRTEEEHEMFRNCCHFTGRDKGNSQFASRLSN